MKTIDGKAVSFAIEADLKKRINNLPSPPGLALILVGNDPSSEIYIRMKQKKCQTLGILSSVHRFTQNTPKETILSSLFSLGEDPSIHGILIQQPLPPHLNLEELMLAIPLHKDVDGFHPIHLGQLLSGSSSGMVPCTPLGIHTLLEKSNISTEGKHVVIMGRSTVVGKPLAALLLQKKRGFNASVTVVHSKSSNLKEITKSGDILITAMGQAEMITREWVKPGAVVVDVGISRVGTTLKGDVLFADVAPIASAITPVPGGVGPMTVIMLMSNTVLSAEKNLSP